MGDDATTLQPKDCQLFNHCILVRTRSSNFQSIRGKDRTVDLFCLRKGTLLKAKSANHQSSRRVTQMRVMRQIKLLYEKLGERKTLMISFFVVFILVWIPVWRLTSAFGKSHLPAVNLRASGSFALLETGCLISGPLSILASLYNWNWFFEQRRVRSIDNLIGRTLARILYTLIGLFMSLVALVGLLLPLFGYGILFQDMLHR